MSGVGTLTTASRKNSPLMPSGPTAFPLLSLPNTAATSASVIGVFITGDVGFKVNFFTQLQQGAVRFTRRQQQPAEPAMSQR